MSYPAMPPHSSPPPDARRGQTLAEFAISLPILLLLLFGILEFGRLFQSWVTLQNAARTAARYAITGQYDTRKYDIDYLVPCLANQATRVQQFPRQTTQVPIFSPAGEPARTQSINIFASQVNPSLPPPAAPFISQPVGPGLLSINGSNIPDATTDDLFTGQAFRSYDQQFNSSGQVILERFQPFTQEVVTALAGAGITSVRVVVPNPDESFYSTWYGLGIPDCFPDDDSLQDRRDIMRLLSIYDEARRGASGLSLDTSLTGSGTLEDLNRFVRDVWSNPSPAQETRGWFNVLVCSSRGKRYTTETRIDPAFTDGTRFETRLDDPQYPGGACLLREQPAADYQDEMIDNLGRPWADAGSAGERITIVVTYNHPLITPLGLARYVPIQARRSAVNESFKVTNAERVVGPASAGSPSLPTETPPPPTLTPSITPPNTATFTPSVTPSITTTPTMAPFDCSLIRATDLAYGRNGRSLIVRFSNGNSKPTTFNRALLVWPTSKLVIAGQAVSQTPYAAYSTLDSDIHWEGNPPNPAPQAPAQAALISPLDTIDSRYGIFYPGAYRTVDAEGEAFWEITFLDFGNRRLAEITFGYDFFGTKFYFQNPDYPAVQPEICEVSLVTPPAPPLPTPPPPNFTPSPTHTPDCADNRMRVQFVSFDRNADVRLRVTNNSSTPGYLIGFTLFWPSNVPGLRLSSVVVGGRDANDIPSPNNPNGAGTLVWENTQGATTSPTLSHAPSPSARWIADYIFPPNSITDVHLNFTGYAVTLQALGLHQSVFNGSVLRIACTPATGTTPRPGQGPGGGGPGGTPGSSGDIGFDAVPTPPPTPLPPPTNTPGPTLTPSNTPTRGPATATWTRQPPTMTFTPSPTPAASNTPLPSATPTDSNFGGSDGG